MPVRCTSSSFTGTPISTIASAATFTAASQPSRSAAGSVSATPMACARFTASSNERPFSISVRTTLVVELSTPENPCRTVGQAEWKHRKNRNAIHDRRFVKKLLLFFVSERREFAKGMDDRPFVCRNRMCSDFERGLQVLDRRVAGLRIERAGLEQNIRARFFEPLANVPARLGRR